MPISVQIFPHQFSATVKIPNGTTLKGSQLTTLGVPHLTVYVTETSNYQYHDYVWKDCTTLIGISVGIYDPYTQQKQVTLTKDFYFDICPLKPDTQYTLYTNDNNTVTTLGSFTTLPATTQYHCIYDEYEVDIPYKRQSRYRYDGHSGLTFEEKVENAELFREYLLEREWSDSAIAAILGAFYCLGDMNPAYRIPLIHFVNSSSASADYKVQQNQLFRALHMNEPYYIDTDWLPADIGEPDYWHNYVNASSVQPTRTWGAQTYNSTGGGEYRYPINKMGLLGIGGFSGGATFSTDFNVKGLYHFDKNVFSKGNWLSGEYQIEYLNYEAFANLNWRQQLGTENIMYSDFIHYKGDPQVAAEIFATHHNYLITSGSPQWYDDEARRTLECIKQWAQYFYKPTRKKHKMPIWEYLRYTI